MTQKTDPMIIEARPVTGRALRTVLPTARPRVAIAMAGIVSGAIVFAGLTGSLTPQTSRHSSVTPASLNAVVQIVEQREVRDANQLANRAAPRPGISAVQMLENREIVEANGLDGAGSVTRLTAAEVLESQDVAAAIGLSHVLVRPQLTEVDFLERRLVNEANALNVAK